ncbi:hypothetical protein KVMX100_120715 [Klebsiella variicola]|nr:hypothetical protein KVMX100_120715 [Klebsiella variicola]
MQGGATLARPTRARRENVGPVRRSRHRALKRERRWMPIAGRRYACPAYTSAQGECRPAKAQSPPGIEAGEALDACCRAALRLPGLHERAGRV